MKTQLFLMRLFLRFPVFYRGDISKKKVFKSAELGKET